MSEHVGARLRAVREHLGWTQEHLAAVSGKSVRTIQRAERGDDLGAETLQALAAALDITVAELQQPLPSEDEIRRALESVTEKYTFVPLKRIERPEDLRDCMGADAGHVGRHAELTDDQEQALATLEELLGDYGDVWSDIPPTRRPEALRTMFEHVKQLRASGIVVAAGFDRLRLRAQDAKEPFTMNVLRVIASSAANPVLVAVREKNAPVQFA